MHKFSIVLSALSIVLSTSAFADVKVLTVSGDETITGRVTYDVNAPLGRAWINVESYDYTCTGEDCSGPNNLRAKVAGMVYSAEHKAVVYTEAGAQPVVCARYVKHWYGTTLDSTGLCGITRVETSKVVIDDGYDTREEVRQNIFFGKDGRFGRRGD